MLAILLVTIWGGGLELLIFYFVIVGWVLFARLARAQFVALKPREYILSARSLGASDVRLMLRHILPNAAGPMVVILVIAIPEAIFAEAGLSVLGLGVKNPIPSWGKMIAEGAPYASTYWYLMVIPTILIASPCSRSPSSATVCATRLTRTVSSPGPAAQEGRAADGTQAVGLTASQGRRRPRHQSRAWEPAASDSRGPDVSNENQPSIQPADIRPGERGRGRGRWWLRPPRQPSWRPASSATTTGPGIRRSFCGPVGGSASTAPVGRPLCRGEVSDFGAAYPTDAAAKQFQFIRKRSTTPAPVGSRWITRR